MTRLLAADVGGTNTRLAIVTTGGEIVTETRIRSDYSRLTGLAREQLQARIIDTLSKACESLLAEHGSVAAFGIGFPGFFVGNSGDVAASPNLPALKGFKLGLQLQQRLGIPVTAQNDALCAALGEFRFGVGKGQSHLLHLTLGTGIGGGLILNGRPHTGEHGMAAEFGHLRVVSDEGKPCGCGGRGCVEAYASASAVQKRAAALGLPADAARLFAIARSGEGQAQEIFAEAGSFLGRAIAEAIKLLDIRHVSISGGLTGAWPFLQPAMEQAMNDALIPPLRGKVSILRSTLNDRGGLLGAGLLAEELARSVG